MTMVTTKSKKRSETRKNIVEIIKENDGLSIKEIADKYVKKYNFIRMPSILKAITFLERNMISCLSDNSWKKNKKSMIKIYKFHKEINDIDMCDINEMLYVRDYYFANKMVNKYPFMKKYVNKFYFRETFSPKLDMLEFRNKCNSFEKTIAFFIYNFGPTNYINILNFIDDNYTHTNMTNIKNSINSIMNSMLGQLLQKNGDTISFKLDLIPSNISIDDILKLITDDKEKYIDFCNKYPIVGGCSSDIKTRLYNKKTKSLLENIFFILLTTDKYLSINQIKDLVNSLNQNSISYNYSQIAHIIHRFKYKPIIHTIIKKGYNEYSYKLRDIVKENKVEINDLMDLYDSESRIVNNFCTKFTLLSKYFPKNFEYPSYNDKNNKSKFEFAITEDGLSPFVTKDYEYKIPNESVIDSASISSNTIDGDMIENNVVISTDVTEDIIIENESKKLNIEENNIDQEEKISSSNDTKDIDASVDDEDIVISISSEKNIGKENDSDKILKFKNILSELTKNGSIIINGNVTININ